MVKEPASHRPEPMPQNRPKSRNVILIAGIVALIIVGLAVATLIGVYESPAWTGTR